jgi:hypothetical protein
MKFAVALFSALVLLPGALGSLETANRRISCKSTANSASCYWMHGRLAFYNGTPALRLWKVGTHRLLGIYSAPVNRRSPDNENPELPQNIRSAGFGTDIFADFEVCPLEPETPNSMQAACIESAKNVVIRKKGD